MDSRYTTTREWCGQPKPMWIARFCGEWIGKGENKSDAVMLCVAHCDARERGDSHYADGGKVTP